MTSASLAPPFPMFNPKMLRPVLAAQVVRFVGEPIAAVLTEQRYQGQDAAELVDVDLVPMPVVPTIARAATGTFCCSRPLRRILSPPSVSRAIPRCSTTARSCSPAG